MEKLGAFILDMNKSLTFSYKWKKITLQAFTFKWCSVAPSWKDLKDLSNMTFKIARGQYCIKCLSTIVSVSQPSVEVQWLLYCLLSQLLHQFLDFVTKKPKDLHMWKKCISNLIWGQFQPYKIEDCIYEWLYGPTIISNYLPTGFSVFLFLLWTSKNSWPMTWFTPLIVNSHSLYQMMPHLANYPYDIHVIF